MSEPGAGRRIVVFHPGAVGDVLLAVPALRALRAQAADQELVLAVQPRIGRLLTALGVVDRAVTFDTLGIETLFADGEPAEGLRRLVGGARVVSWFGHADAEFVGRLRGLAADAIVAPTRAPVGSSVWEHLLATVGMRSVDDAWREPIGVPSAMADEGRRALLEAGWDGVRPLLMLHPGAGGPAKRWAAEGFAAVARTVAEAAGAGVVVHDGPADHEAVATLCIHLHTSVIRLAEPSLETLAGVMPHAALWLGNDSGVTHLAAATGTPTLALFVAPNLAWRPWARHARVRVVKAGALARAEGALACSEVDAVVGDVTGRLGSRVTEPR